MKIIYIFIFAGLLNIYAEVSPYASAKSELDFIKVKVKDFPYKSIILSENQNLDLLQYSNLKYVKKDLNLDGSFEWIISLPAYRRFKTYETEVVLICKSAPDNLIEIYRVDSGAVDAHFTFIKKRNKMYPDIESWYVEGESSSRHRSYYDVRTSSYNQSWAEFYYRDELINTIVFPSPNDLTRLWR